MAHKVFVGLFVLGINDPCSEPVGHEHVKQREALDDAARELVRRVTRVHEWNFPTDYLYMEGQTEQ